MQIKDVMTENIITLDSDKSCFEAAQIMKNHNVGCLPILENNKLIGILTDRDIVVRTVADNLLPADCNVKDYMTPSPIAVGIDIDVHEAANIMAENQIRRLPVVSQDSLIGLISLGDLAIQADTEAERVLEQVSKPIRKDIAA